MEWKHPDLGVFRFDEPEWEGRLDLPAFHRFGYDTGEVDQPRTTGLYPLTFETEDGNEVPSEAAIRLATQIKIAQKQLVEDVVSSLWNDFNDVGPSSEMWWRGSVADVMRHAEHHAKVMKAQLDIDIILPPPLDSAESLYAWMQLAKVRIRKDADGGGDCLAELEFSAAFEPEHDVGILTDGKAILGIGYGYEVERFATE